MSCVMKIGTYIVFLTQPLKFQGAFWALVVGFVVGLIRFGLEFGFDQPKCGSNLPDPRPEWVQEIVGRFHYLHFGAFLFGFSMVVAAIVSYVTKPIPEENVRVLPEIL